MTTIWLDRGYDSAATRERLVTADIDDAMIGRKRKRGSTGPAPRQPMGLCWQVERTNSWLSNFGRPRYRFIVTAKLIDYRNRWMADLSLIR